MVVLSLHKKTQIGYTQYVDNDVYVDDVFTFCTAKAMDGSFAESVSITGAHLPEHGTWMLSVESSPSATKN